MSHKADQIEHKAGITAAATMLRMGVIVFTMICLCVLISCNRDRTHNDEQPRGQSNINDYNEAHVTIRFRPQWHHQAQFAGVYMAFEKGFYRNLGLDVIIQSGGPDNPGYESLQKGSSDITSLFLLTALSKTNPHNELVNLAQISQKSALMLIGKRSRGINTISDLNKKRIGLWYSDFRDLSLAFLKDNNIASEIIPLGGTINLFLNNAIDVVNVMLYNEYHQILMAGVEPDDLFEIRFSDLDYDVVEDGIYTTRNFFDKHPEACQAFAEATMDGWMYALNHPDETLSVVTRYMKQDYIPANRPHQQWMLEKMGEVILHKPDNIGKLTKADFDRAVKLIEKDNPSLSSISFSRFTAND